MALVTTTEMFKKAYNGGYAIGAFNVNNMEIVQGITEAAKDLEAPLILQVSKGARSYANHTYLMKLVEAAVIETGDGILFLRDLDRMQQVRDDQRIDDVQGHCRQDELSRHHLRVDADQGGCDATHGHHGERQTAVSLHALELEA